MDVVFEEVEGGEEEGGEAEGAVQLERQKPGLYQILRRAPYQITTATTPYLMGLPMEVRWPMGSRVQGALPCTRARTALHAWRGAVRGVVLRRWPLLRGVPFCCGVRGTCAAELPFECCACCCGRAQMHCRVEGVATCGKGAVSCGWGGWKGRHACSGGA